MKRSTNATANEIRNCKIYKTGHQARSNGAKHKQPERMSVQIKHTNGEKKWEN